MRIDLEDLVLPGILIVVFAVFGIGIWATISSNHQTIDEYNSVATAKGWEKLEYSSSVQIEDVQHAIILAKMHIQPTSDDMQYTKKKTSVYPVFIYTK